MGDFNDEPFNQMTTDIEHAATQFAALLGEVDRFPLNHLREGPLER